MLLLCVFVGVYTCVGERVGVCIGNCVTVCCRVLQHSLTCSMRDCVAVGCRVMQIVAGVLRSEGTLQRVSCGCMLQCVAVTATHGNTHCNTLQHTATHCNTQVSGGYLVSGCEF